jgi:hypothetical protein
MMRRASFALAALAVAGLVAVLPACSNSNNPASTAAISMSLSGQGQITQGDTTADVAISANIDSDGAPIADGTLVTFETDYGSFTGGGSRVAEATQGGVASATLTVPIPGTAHVSVSVQDVVKSLSVQVSVSSIAISS